MLNGYLRIGLTLTIGGFILFSCRNKCRDIDCGSDHKITFQIKDYSSELIQDSLLSVLYRNEYQSPFISKGNGQFSVMVYGSGKGEFSVFYNDTLRAFSSFNLKSKEGECCNYYVPTELIIDGELKCRNGCSRDSVYNVEF